MMEQPYKHTYKNLFIAYLDILYHMMGTLLEKQYIRQ
jgi:hypothetical protein